MFSQQLLHCDFADVIKFVLRYYYVNLNYHHKLFHSDHYDGFACSTILFLV